MRYISYTILHFIDIICRDYTRIYSIQSFSYSVTGVIFDKSILSRSYKLGDADPAGTLDSCYGIQNEQKNTQNNVIECIGMAQRPLPVAWPRASIPSHIL